MLIFDRYVILQPLVCGSLISLPYTQGEAEAVTPAAANTQRCRVPSHGGSWNQRACPIDTVTSQRLLTRHSVVLVKL